MVNEEESVGVPTMVLHFGARPGDRVHMSGGRGGSVVDPAPTFITVHGSLDAVRMTLVALGAVAQTRRSVALDLGEHLLLLDYDSESACTVVAVGGGEALSTASWLAPQLEDAGLAVEGLLPPVVAAS
jgi:hypothetical protein